MPITYQAAIKRYADVQGNILKGHGREHARLLFLQFGTAPAARQWINDLIAGGNGQPGLTSTAKQLQDSLERKKDKAFDGGLFASLFLSAEGYRFLGAALPQETPNQAPFALRNAAFDPGMRTGQTQQMLKDPALGTWDAGWQTAGQPTAIHALLLLADDDAKQLEKWAAIVRSGLTAVGASVQVEEHGKALFNAAGAGIEHFGYADGVSQPIYLTEDVDPGVHSPLDSGLDAEELVLVPEPGGSFGSFFVFRKLAQDVPGFKQAEDDLDKELSRQAQAQGIAYANDGGALVVGRTEEGAPVAVFNPKAPFSPPITNNFDYSADQAGLKCPFHAHIRKMNPRGETNNPQELRLRLTRRGIPYGEPTEQEKGLLFMCYQRNIAQQFEFLQTRWANEAGFLKAGTGLDSIIGQGQPRPDIFTPFEWGKAAGGSASFGEFVTLQGGEYFYAPSLGALAALAGAPAKSTVF